MDRTVDMQTGEIKEYCLNPYSNGIWIEHFNIVDKDRKVKVLILILMEYG